MLSPPNPAEVGHFLADISDAPLDDEPRLVFADWLQERGHPWGELIAVQCGLVHAAPASPERARLLRREHELLSDRSWWPYDGSGFQVDTFLRGFPGGIRAANAAGLKTLLSRMPWMPDAQCIELPLHENDMLGLVALGRLPTQGFAFVSGDNYFFDLLDAKLFVHWLERHALRLRRFSYSGMAQPAAIEMVLSTPLVRRVLEDVGFAYASHQSRPEWLEDMPRLRSVRLTGMRASLRAPLAARLEDFAETDLSWERPGTVREGPPEFGRLLPPERGTSVTLLDTLRLLTRVERLNLSSRGLADASAMPLLACAAPTLRSLAFAKNPITSATVEGLVAKPHLTELELWGCPIGDAGAEMLARTRCESLELMNTGMTEHGARALAESSTLPPTLRLVVSRAEVGSLLSALRDRYALVLAR